MADAAARVRAFDWLRGLAVLVMVECHALVLLRPELRAGPHFKTLNFINGLVAPSFIFAAGFSIGLIQVRSARLGARRQRFLRTLRRIGEVFGVGLLLNLMWFWYPLRDDPTWLFRVDILQCIAFALLAALPLTSLLATRPKVLAGVTLLIAAGIFGVAPFGELVQGFFAPVLNNHTGTVFPLLPWAGYVFLGIFIGVLAATTTVRRVQLALGLLAGVGLLLNAWTPGWTFYPPHDFFVNDPGNCGHRWFFVCAILIVLLEVETRFAGAWRTSLPIRWVELFGTSSLAGYFFHESLLYYRVFGFSFAALWKDGCGWGKYALLLGCLLALTTTLVWVTDKVYRFLDAKTRPERPRRPDPAGLGTPGLAEGR
jgi:uncharacterized membrane protein